MQKNPKIIQYVEILKKWQSKVNLISPTTLNEIWERHIEDSDQLLKFISKNVSAIIDLGTGAGLPGMILGIESDLPTYLVESDRKKCLFLEEVSRQLKLEKIKVINKRIEDAEVKISGKIIITARALASLEKLFDLIKTLLEKNKIESYTLLLPKGKSADAEIEDAKKHWNFTFEKHKSITDAEASILVIDQFERRNN